jgi:hypothetical protein
LKSSIEKEHFIQLCFMCQTYDSISPLMNFFHAIFAKQIVEQKKWNKILVVFYQAFLLTA